MRNHHPYRLLLVAALLLALVLVVSCSKPQPTPMLPTAVVTTFPTPTGVPMAAATPTSAPQQTAAPTAPPLPAPSAPATSAPTQAIPSAALVNNQPVPLQEYEAQVTLAINALSQQQNLNPETEEGKVALQQLRRQILDSMIDQILIEQAAARQGIVVPMERVELEMARLIGEDAAKFEEWLQANGLTRDSFKIQLQRQLITAAFQEDVVGALPPEVEQVHARHILVTSEAEAMDVLIKLRAGESFAALAQQYSLDSANKDQGGDLGFFPRGIMPVEIEAVAFALNPGQVSGIVKSSFGYHIIEVVEKDPQRSVAEEMLTAWRKNRFLDWLEAERTTAKIEYLIPMQ